MHIIIPSYNRVDVLRTMTYKNLIEAGIKENEINIFVANQEQYDLYRATFNMCNIIIGVKGIENIRNFIQDYYNNGDILVSFDDDLKSFVFKEDSNLKKELNKMEECLNNSNCSIIGVNPTGNKFYMRPNKEGQYIKTGLYFCVGCCFMWKNDKSIKVSGFLDDYERTLYNYEKYKNVMRNDNLSFKTKYYAKGGIGKRSLENYTSEVNRINKLFSNITSIKIKSNKANLENFGVKNIPHLLVRKKKLII